MAVKFESASPILDRYFRKQATRDVRRLVTARYVATPLDTPFVAGFYTLAAGSVVLSDLPEAMAKKLPRYPAVPVVRLGRLAVGRRFTVSNLARLFSGMPRSVPLLHRLLPLPWWSKPRTSAAAFYRHHGFIPCADQSPQLFLPLASFRSRI